jgi:hypothetical protein
MLTGEKNGSVVMAEKLTWGEIKQRYPDEWVILLDVEGDDLAPEIEAGVVFEHGKNCRELVAQTKDALAGKSRTILYTGEVGRGNYLF